MKKYIFTLVLILVAPFSRAEISSTDMDLYCAGMLLRTAGLIKENIARFNGEAKSQLLQVTSHLDNNGTILLNRATKVTGFTVQAKGVAAIGMGYADKQIGSDVMVAIRKGTDQHEAVLNCLRRTSQ